MKNFTQVNRALAAEKNFNLIEMLRGCSKRSGTTFRQSNPDGQPTVNRQSRLMSHQGYLRNLAMIFAVLVMSVGQMWSADQVLKTVDFSTSAWSSATFTANATTVVDGVTASSGSSSSKPTISISSGKFTMSSNMSSGKNCVGFQVSGIQYGTLIIEVYSDASTITRCNYTVKDGGSSFSTSDAGSGTSSTVGEPIIVTGLTKTSAYVYVGRQGSSYTQFSKIIVKTPNPTGKTYAESTFYTTYASSSKTNAQLISSASFPENFLPIFAGASALNDKPASTPTVTTPYDFSGVSTSSNSYILQTAENNVLLLNNVANVKSVRFYGDGNGSSGNISVNVTKQSGSGSTFSVSNISFTSTKTILEHSTGDLTGKSGYDANTFYNYKFTFSKKFHIWGVYVEAIVAEKDYTVTAATSTGDNTYGTVSAGASSLDATETTTITATPATGYQVTNWAVSGTGASISPDGASNSNTTTLTMGTAHATVTATFGPKSYTVTLNNQSATTAGTESVPTTYNANTNLTSAIICPTKTSKVFAGYFTATNGGGVQLIDAAGNWIASAGGGSTYLDGSKNWKNDGNLTLYACWMEYASTFDIQAWVQSNIDDTKTSTTYTILGTNKLIYSLGGSSALDNSNKSSYEGLKMKNSGDYVMFLVQANSALKLYFGYTGTDPKKSINGGAEANMGVSSTGTETANQEVDFGTQTYDRLVKVRTVNGNSVVLQKIEITSSCTAPSSVSVDATNANGWRYSIGETIDLTCTAEGGTGTKTYQWQKYIGSTWTDINTATNASAGTAHLQIANCTSSDGGSYRCVVSTGAGCELASSGYQVYVFTLNGNYYGSVWTENAITWTGANTGTVTLDLTESSTYMYKVTNNDNKWYGGTSGNFLVLPAARDHYTDQTADIRLFTGPAGNYTFTIDITHFNDYPGTPYVNISVAYPTVSHPASGYAYFKKWNDWSGYYIHWWYNDGSDHPLSTWGSDPQVTTETTICGTDYIYFPVLDTYNKLIVKDAAGDASHTTGDLSSVGSSGKYFDFTNNNAWNTFTTYTVSAAVSPAGYGTVSAASVTGVACGTSISASTNTLTVGATSVTATPASATAEYTYAFDNWTWTPAGATVTSDVTATANFTRTPKSYTLTWNLAGGKVTVAGTGAAVNATGTPSSSVAFGTDITAPTLTRTGYTFAGWSSTPASTMPAANTTYTATWTANQYSVTHSLTGVTTSSGATGANAATYGTDYTAVFAKNSGYTLPNSVTVTAGGSDITANCTYTKGTGTVSIPGSYITGNIVITVTGVEEEVCPSSASGAVVYKFVTKSSGLGTSAICAAANTDYPLTTGDGNPLETLTSGTLTACASSAGTTQLKYNVSSINFNGGTNGWLIIGLNCAIQSGDIIRYVNSNSGSVAIHTAKGTSTNEIVLAGNSKTTVQTVVITSAQATAFSGLKTIYMERKSNTSDISYFEIIRPYVVTLNANTNGGNVGGENTKTMYFVADEAQLLPRATKSDYLFKGWFNASSGGDAVANPYTATTSPKTLYAQFDDCSSTSGTVYKIQVKTGLTNANIAAGDLNEGNYLSAMDGGTAVITGSHAQIVNNNAIDFKDNGDYITVNLDCELKAGDYFKTTISGSKSGIKVTTTSSTTSLQDISYGTNLETEVPASLVGSKTFRIYRKDSNCGGLSYFEIVRPNGVTITGAVSPDGYGTVSPASIFVASGSTVSLASNVLTCDGKTLTATPTATTAEYTYAFSSWSGVTNGGTVSVATTATANFTRTANNYTLAWSSNGGSDLAGSYTSGSTAYNTTLVAPNDPTLSNYTFDGWNTANDGSGSAAAATMPAANTTYYAAWKQTVTLTTGAQGSGSNQTPIVYLNGTSVSDFTPHTASGYALQGYYTAGSGGVKVLNADGTFASANVDGYITSSKWSRTGAAPTLFAQWVASEDCSTSDFVIKTGSSEQYQGCMESSSYNGTATSFTAGSATTVGNAKMTISSYSKGAITRPGSGNTFSIVIEPLSGYYLKSVCWAGKVESGETVSYYWDDNSESATTISAQTTSETGVTYNAPNSTTTKFTASYVDDGVDGGGIWWRNVQVEVCAAGGTIYNVTYDGNDETDGTAPTDGTNYSYGGTVTVKDNGTLEKDNYTFAGWATNNDGTGSSYVEDNTFSITANTTLYAKWTQAVTLEKNGGSTDGSATAVWNATGLTGITHAKPAAGYKLLGYYSASSDGTKVLNSDGSFAATNVTDYITDGKWSRTSATTLYAEYESAGALTWNLIVNSDTTDLSTSTKTSAFTEISTTNMTNAALTGLNYDGSTKKSSLTGKIGAPTSLDAAKYVKVTFQVASGYKFTPSSIKVPIQPVSGAADVKLVLVDNAATPDSIGKVQASLSKGSITTVEMTNGSSVEFTGTVTLKIYCYGSSTGTYRLGTPITIEGEVEEACGTMPSYKSMSYTTTTFAPGANASGSPITIVGGTNIDTYQWKYNTVNDRTSGTNCGTGTSLTPLTDAGAEADVTRYYWCEMTNEACGITIKSPAVAITVASAKSNATVTWTDPASTPNYGGGGYTIKATVDQSAWDGNAADLVITAPAGIRIYNVSSGTDGSSRKYVQADFDVQTSFDRTTYASNIPFTVSAAATATYNAISNDHNTAYSACSGGGEGSSYNIRMRKTVTKDGNYYHCANTDGWISPNISSSYSTAKAGTKMETDFDTVASSNTQYVWVRTYHANVNKVRIYADFRANDMTVSNVYKHTDYFTANNKYLVDYTAVYNDDEENENTGTAAQGYVDITLDEVMAANDILLVKFNDNKVRPLGAVITEGSAGSLNTHLQWSGGLADDATVAKNTTDAYFTYSASKVTENTNTLGAITYSSSDPSVATVDATGKVALVAAGSTTIKATLAASGCYKKAEISYTLNVTEVACAITAGTLTLTSGTETKCEDDEVTLTLTGFESDASIQWKDGDTNINNGGNYTIETDGTTSTLTTDQPGTYSVMVTKDCSVRSNRITISNKSTEVGAKRIVKNWYIKNGRPTPDIELWTLQNGAHLSSVAWDPVNATGLTASDFYESDGKVYLKGKEPSSNASGEDINYTLTLTVVDDCGSTTAMSASEQLIYLHHQKNTDKHVLAFVVTGTEKGGFTEGITAAQTTSVELYNTIAANFDVLATNIYSTDDEQALKEYYSQFDILCITDYPNTGTKGVNKKSYVDALGALVDIRPILTMEAFVAKLANWKAKGISGTPQSPTTRQYTMLLQCKDHEIFSGTKLTKVGEGDTTMYRVSMVCDTLEDYKTLDATYGSETHAEKSGYNYGGKPALQGFTFTKEMLDDDLLPLGLIDDGSGNDLQVGIERQTEMEARLMVLGINSYAMERLTDDGQTVVVNALKYLMKKNSEDIADCSNTFVGGDDEEDESTRSDWNVASHWSGNAVPDRTQKVRIVAPCVIKAGEKFHVTGVVIAPSGKYNHGANTANGSLTIAAGGALIVDGKVEAATAPLYTEIRATSAEDLTIQTSSTAQGALIFDNDKGDTKATVNLYSLGRKPSSYQYQYFAVPMEVVPVNPTFANETHGGTGIYTYVYEEASSGWTRRKYYDDLFAFEGLGITTKSETAMNYTMAGNLASTATKEITLTHDGAGLNLIGNSWMAPIQIGALAEDNTDANITQTVYIYCAGRDAEGGAVVSSDDTETAGQWLAVPFEAAEFETWKEAGKLSVIPAMQAFQIKVADEATLTLDYDKVVRGSTNDLNAKLRAPGRRMAANEVTMTNIRVADSKTHTDLSLFEGDRFSEAFDNGWEAEYMNGDGRSAKLYAETEAGQMAVAAMYDYEGTVVGFVPGQETEYTFSFMGEDNGYYLNDIKLQNSVRISEGETYTFTYEEGDAANRFYISRTPIDAPQTSTGVDNTGNGEVKARKFIYRDKMYILINGRVYSADGALVK